MQLDLDFTAEQLASPFGQVDLDEHDQPE